jgi:hypothetical protein
MKILFGQVGAATGNHVLIMRILLIPTIRSLLLDAEFLDFIVP